MKRKQGIALVAAGIMLGTAISGPAAQAAEMLAAQRSTQKIYVNGEEVQMDAYAINGANYVKLRDLGRAVGFEVGYDAATNSVYVGEQPKQSGGRVVALPADGSKYTPRAGDLIPCGDGTLYEIRDVSRFENNAAAPDPLPDLPEPTCDWSLFPTLELPAPEVRHYVSDAGDNLFVRNVYETRRMQYTLYNAIGRTPESWRDGKPLAKVSSPSPLSTRHTRPCSGPGARSKQRSTSPTSRAADSAAKRGTTTRTTPSSKRGTISAPYNR